jgi:hypothetical protein
MDGARTGGAYTVSLDGKAVQQAVGASVQIHFDGSVESGQLVQSKTHSMPDNIVLTDAHLLNSGTGVMKITTADGKSYGGKLLKLDKDIAWVEVEGLPNGLPHVTIGEPGDVPAIPTQGNQSPIRNPFVIGVGHNATDPAPTVYGAMITGMTSKAKYMKRADQINGQSTQLYNQFQGIINKLSPKDRQEAQADFEDSLYEVKGGCTQGGSGGQLDALNGKLIGLCESAASGDPSLVRQTYITLDEILHSQGSATGPDAAKVLSDASAFTFDYEQVANFDAAINGTTVPSLKAIHRKNNDPRPPFNSKILVEDEWDRLYGKKNK